MPLSSRDIKTNYQDVVCDVCGRTLLRGERAEPFLAGGQRRLVCELCTVRATHGGWIRESGDQLTTPQRDEGRRGVFGGLSGLRRRRPQPSHEPDDELELHPALAAELEDHPVVQERRKPPEPEPMPDFSRELRQVHAVPTNAELKMERAVDVFNTSQYCRTVAGVARSLGAPDVSVRTSESEPSVVSIFVMWELSWYRFEVDLSDEAGGARQVAQGAELSELDEGDRVVNATSDDRGRLSVASAP